MPNVADVNEDLSTYDYWVAGDRRTSDQRLLVVGPDRSPVAEVALPSAADVERAIAIHADYQAVAPELPLGVRADALLQVAARLLDRQEEFARAITAENGKPIKWSRIEVQRASSVFRWAAEETRRWNGEVQRLDTDSAGEGRMAVIRRFPKGPVLAIAPFNFPLNLVAHKVAPALAVGAPVLVKPAPATPVSALLLGELLAETELPGAMWSVLPVPNEGMPNLVSDPRLPVVSFTGSAPVGYSIAAAVPNKHVVLELGGNAAVLVMADYSSPADLSDAAGRIATFANYQAGQSCISVQRVLVDRSLYDDMVTQIVVATELLNNGDVDDDSTDVGPLVDERAAVRVTSWIEEAVSAGAQLLTGGVRDGAKVAPTVLIDVPHDAKVWSEEVFGPVTCIAPFDGVDDAVSQVNDSRFGLQVGVFTKDLHVAFRMHSLLDVGGVIIGDVPSFRADQMPYGGVKESGVGREGVRSTMTDFTDERVLVLSGLTF